MMALRVIIVAVLSAMYPVSPPKFSAPCFDTSGAQCPGHCSCTAPASILRLEITPRKAPHFLKNSEGQAAARIQVLAGLRRCVDWISLPAAVQNALENTKMKVEMAALASSASRKLLAGVQGSFSPMVAAESRHECRKSRGLADCRQTEPVATRVALRSASGIAVQSADVVSYDRFCLYTCKPLLTDEIKPVVDCAHLNDKEITDLAQSPSSNGREIVYEAHPLARVGPISRVLAQPEASMLDTSVVDRSSDPVSAIRATFASLRKEETAAPGVSPYTLPDAAKAPPLCVCHCGNKVNRMRQTESDGILYPKPKQVRLPLAVTSAGNPAAQPEPPQPPMPPSVPDLECQHGKCPFLLAVFSSVGETLCITASSPCQPTDQQS
ncbi:FUBP3 [Symbiodinium sp. CCMP2592]|nr:FUBP3 [Symbiodinium sp. CCMP2592]